MPEDNKSQDKVKDAGKKSDPKRSQTVGDFLGEFLYNTNSFMRSTTTIIQEMTILIPALLVVLLCFLVVLTWATAQSGAIPLGVNMGISNILGETTIGPSIPREYTTTIKLFGRGIAGITIGF